MKRFLLIVALFIAGMGVQAQGCFMSGNHPAVIPQGQTATYAVVAVRGNSYQWTTTGGLQIQWGQNSNICIVKNVNSCSGTVTVVRSGSNSCTATQNVTDGTGCGGNGGGGTQPPAAPIFIDINPMPCNMVEINHPSVSGATGYNVYIDGVLVLPAPNSNYYFSSSYPHIMANGPHMACVEAFNSGGSSA